MDATKAEQRPVGVKLLQSSKATRNPPTTEYGWDRNGGGNSARSVSFGVVW